MTIRLIQGNDPQQQAKACGAGHHKKCGGGGGTAKKQEYDDLVAQAQALGITDIPPPGKGAIEQLQALIDQKQAQPDGTGAAQKTGCACGLSPNGCNGSHNMLKNGLLSQIQFIKPAAASQESADT